MLCHSGWFRLNSTQEIQYSVHPPNRYLHTNQFRLLPTWSVPVCSVLLVLQHCQPALLERTPETEQHKEQLRQIFLKFGNEVALELGKVGYLTEIFDPRTGFPMLSSPGSSRLDDVAIARSILGYSVMRQGNCSILIHPTWQTSVYPSTIVSAAPTWALETVIDILRQGKKPSF